jgi:hypothetical protein
MTEFYIDPEDAVSDFLRVFLTDPRARAEATETQTFNPGNGDTVITLAAPTAGSVSCVTGVTIDGASMGALKWTNYHWDYQNTVLTFYTAFAGTEEVIVTYKYGTQNWIYSDKPDDKVKATDFPRISVFNVSAPGSRLGNYEAPVEGSVILQIDVWSKDRYSKTIGGRTYSNNYMTRYLGNQITKAFEDNESSLFPLLYNYIPVSGPRAAPYSTKYQAYHTIIDINLKGLKIGRIEV